MPIVLVGAISLVIACADSAIRPLAPEAVRPQFDHGPPPYNTHVYVHAHQDDWQFFIGNVTIASVLSAEHVVLVYTTAGDAGSATSFPAYWQARETASKASVDAMVPSGTWACTTPTINAHPILRCAKGKVISYYMRLPDGNGHGQGYGAGSLDLLRTGQRLNLRTVDATTTYATWTDLVTTMRALIDQETTNQSAPYVWVHASDYDDENNEGDHPDHKNSGQLVRTAAQGRSWNQVYYLGYPGINNPPNLSSSVHTAKRNVFLAYDNVMAVLMGERLAGDSNAEAWLWRTYYRTVLASGPPPVPPSAPTTLATQAISSSRIDLTWADNASTEDGFRVERAPDAGGLPGTFAEITTVAANATSYSNTGLSGGTVYWYRIRAYNAGGNSAYTNQATATTPPGAPVAPSAPTGMQASAVSVSAIDLTWVDNATNEDGFRVERAPDVGGAPGTFAEITTLAANVTSYNNTGLSVGTRYWYRVRSYNAVGPSGYSNQASATTASGNGPAAPTNFETSVVNSTTIDLNWSDDANNETGYHLERAPDTGGAPGTFALIATLSVNAVWYSNEGLSPGTYWYRVRAFNAGGPSAYSNLASATLVGPPVAPPAPTNLQGVAVSSSSIDLTWTDNSSNEDGFRVERAPDAVGVPGTFAQIATVAANASAYSNAGLSGGTRYWYRVRAYNTIGNSAYTNQASATTPTAPVAPAAPTGLQASAVSVSAIDLTWADNSNNEDGFGVERAPDAGGVPGTFAQIVTLGQNTTSYSNTGLNDGTRYWYRVHAYNAVGPSAHSNQVSATTPAIPVTPAAPSALQAQAVSASAIDLSWTDDSSNEDGFRVERAPDAGGVAGTFIEVTTVAANATSYGSTGLSAGTRYWYRVRAYNAVGPSGYSNQASATTNSAETVPIAPTSLGASMVNSTTIDLSWSDGASNETGYQVERAADAGGVPGAFTQIATLPANAVSYSNGGVSPGTYWYRVRAINAVGPSGYSNLASVTLTVPPVAPLAPSSLQAVAVSSSEIDLTWTDNSSNEDGFRVELAPDAGGVPGSFAQIATVAANATGYSNSGLSDGTRYWYRVRAYNATGNSAYTNQASATTVVTPGLPVAPSGLTAVAATGTRIELAWVDNSSDESDFQVERAPDAGGMPGTFVLIATPSAGITSYSNTGLTNNTRYWYRVRAHNGVGNSGYSNQADATTLYIPTAPSDLQAVAVSSTGIDLTWVDNSSNETHFRIERAPDVGGVPGTFTQISSVLTGVTTYRARSLAPNTRYWFRVRAYNKAGHSAYTNQTSATTM